MSKTKTNRRIFGPEKEDNRRTKKIEWALKPKGKVTT
jgi:hypothetical protein